MPLAVSDSHAVAPPAPSRSLPAAGTGLLALGLLPLCVLLWSASRGGPSSGAALPVIGTLIAAAVFAGLVSLLALRAADDALFSPASPPAAGGGRGWSACCSRRLPSVSRTSSPPFSAVISTPALGC